MATGCGSSPSDNTSNLATSRTPDKQAVVDGRNTPNSRKPQPRSKERATESSFVGDFEQKEVDDNFDDSTATGIYEKAARAFGAGRGVGMIQAVPHSATTSAIQVSEGGGALGAFSPKVIERFLKRHNRSTSERIKARDNFARSCAGYCVATFILGVGDRHSGNIMCSKDGKLFHIDFGHILGNFKSKYGFRRERTPFVFTPEMAYVLEQIESERLQFKSKSISQNRGRDLKLAHTQRGEGGNSGSSVSDFASMETSESRKIVKKANGYKRFLELAKDAFMVVRRNSAFIESLFSLMVSAGLPELSDIKSIKYLSDQLFSGMDEREAGSKLERMIKQARNDTYRRVDNYIHAVKHKQPSSGTSASAGGARFSRRIKSKNNESQ
eukprot:jgi/Bigna1/86928/estExt_fgenesh1_pg.C_150088